jgi:hypothetical protein
MSIQDKDVNDIIPVVVNSVHKGVTTDKIHSVVPSTPADKMAPFDTVIHYIPYMLFIFYYISCIKHMCVYLEYSDTCRLPSYNFRSSTGVVMIGVSYQLTWSNSGSDTWDISGNSAMTVLSFCRILYQVI